MRPFPILTLPANTALEHYRALAHFHYCASEPRAVAQGLAVLDPHTFTHTRTAIAVLLITHPTLNAPHRTTRTIATCWPQLAAILSAHSKPKARAAALNANLRSIARIVVDPRYRGMGIATALLRHYLTNPLTPFTESTAAMGDISPLFLRAGMTRTTPPLSRRDTILAAKLRDLHINPLTLIDHTHAEALLRASPELCSITLTWADASRSTRHAACTTKDPSAIYTSGPLQHAAHRTLVRMLVPTPTPPQTNTPHQADSNPHRVQPHLSSNNDPTHLNHARILTPLLARAASKLIHPPAIFIANP
jgi:GNAT superfamily N-acetyltransferase